MTVNANLTFLSALFHSLLRSVLERLINKEQLDPNMKVCQPHVPEHQHFQEDIEHQISSIVLPVSEIPSELHEVWHHQNANERTLLVFSGVKKKGIKYLLQY